MGNKFYSIFFDFFFGDNIYYKSPSVPFQLSFQDSATPVMNGLIDLHDYVFFFLIVIIFVVIALLLKVILTFVLNNNEGFSLNYFTDYTFATPYSRLIGLSFWFFCFRMIYYIVLNFILWLNQLLKSFFFFFFFDFKNYLIENLKKQKHLINFDFGKNILNFYSRVKSNILFFFNSQKKEKYKIKNVINSMNLILKLNLKEKREIIFNSIISVEKSHNDEFFFSFNDLHYFNFLVNFNLKSLKNNYHLVQNVIKKILLEQNRVEVYFRLKELVKLKGWIKKNVRIINSIKIKNTANKQIIGLDFFDFTKLYQFYNIREEKLLGFSNLGFQEDKIFNFSKKNEVVYAFADFLNGEKADYIFNINERSGDEKLKVDFKILSEVFLKKKMLYKEELFFIDNLIEKYFPKKNDCDVINEVFENNLISNIFASKYYQRLVFLFSFLKLLFSYKIVKFFRFISKDLVKNVFKQRKNLNKKSFLLFKENPENDSPYKMRKLIDSVFADNNEIRNKSSLFFKSKTKMKNLIETQFLFFTLMDFYINNALSSKIIQLQKMLKTNQFNHSTRLEIIWTVIPIFIIGLIITPSFFLMYAIDEDIESLLTVKVVGHQWYWSYTYEIPIATMFLNLNEVGDIVFGLDIKSLSKFGDSSLISVNDNYFLQRISFSFDSYMLDDVVDGSPRLLATDQVLVLPKYSHINCIVTSTDVIHSWALPSLGVKIDAVPGRLNRTDIFLEHEGMFFGQCSELCGVNHSFMPIQIESVPLSNFLEVFFYKNFSN